MAGQANGLSYDTRCACVFCASLDSARLGIDRRGRPYLHCWRCGARSFLPSRLCLDGYGLIAPVIAELMQMVRSNDQLRGQAEAGRDQFVQQIEAAGGRATG